MSDELARIVRYKPPVLKIGFAAWSGVVPLLTVPLGLTIFGLSLWTIFLIVELVLGVPVLDGFLYMAAALAMAVSVMVFLLWITGVAADDQIWISKDGITFPLFMSPYLRFRRRRLWSEVERIELKKYDEKSDELYGDIVLEFTSGERVNLDMSGFVDVGVKGFEKGELEKFLLACEVFAKRDAVAMNIVELRDWVGNASRETGKLSYTEVWESELTNRFHATVFIPLEPDSTLQNGKLKVVRQLAFGGLAAVYLVQRDGRELLILKEAVVPTNQDESMKSKALEMFEREARFLSLLEHPRIARVYDYFVEQNRHYLLLERITGRNLRQVVNSEGPQAEEIVLKWAEEIAEILVFLHRQQPPIVHRDLTPENLILADDGKIHLIDFGAANQFLGTVTGTVVGKQAFISPEQFRGKATPSSDIYSFGGTLYFLLTGKNPLAMSVMKPASINANVSESLDKLVSDCTAQEIDGRPTSAEDLLSRLQRISSARTQAAGVSK
ncbi:serine/threonine protein kinase [Candidatus Obscuribacterales bacterium]|nr:serine/threonine protein kinase [Candidatus Obscuribacterales bacterium]MBX3151584.1 serine/threonine protein kinase [Candidatus Obscuribacterales bacterium]